MSKLTDEEKEKLLRRAMTLCESISYLLDKCYEAHCKKAEEIKNKSIK